MILYKKSILRIAELWFDEEADLAHLDVLRHFQRTLPREEGKWTRFSTILLDLKRAPETLFERMGKNNRYEIRRAESRDNFRYHLHASPDADCISRFSAFHDQH